MQSFSCTKDLASIHGFDLRLMWESCIDFIHQRRGLKQGYLCPDTVRQLFRLPYTKHWLQARVLISGYGQTVIQDLMHQDLASSYSFTKLRYLLTLCVSYKCCLSFPCHLHVLSSSRQAITKLRYLLTLCVSYKCCLSFPCHLHVLSSSRQAIISNFLSELERHRKT